MTISVRPWDDPTTWNNFVAATPNAHFQQSWEWGELAPQLGGKAERLAVLSNDGIVGAAQVFINPVAHTRSSMLYIPRGPALPSPAVQTLGPLLESVRRLGEESGALGVKVEPNAAADDCGWDESLRAFGLTPFFPPSQPRSSWMLDITTDLDTLLAQMKQKTRYNIRLASRKGVTVSEGGPDDLDAFYDLYVQTGRRDDFFIHDRSLYERMFSLFRSASNFCMLLARYEEKPIAAVTLIRFGRTCWYVHGASANEHRNLMAPYLLQWEAIQRARDWGCTLYDFRAIPDLLREDQDMYGVYRFKEGFGGYQFTALHSYGAPYRPLLYGLLQLYVRGRFDAQAWQRRRKGLPARQFA